MHALIPRAKRSARIDRRHRTSAPRLHQHSRPRQMHALGISGARSAQPRLAEPDRHTSRRAAAKRGRHEEDAGIERAFDRVRAMLPQLVRYRSTGAAAPVDSCGRSIEVDRS
jgi:hypothetical protein